MIILTVINHTKKIIAIKDTLYLVYHDSDIQKNEDPHAFFNEVKAATTPLFDDVMEWEEITLKAIKDQTLKLHPNLINSTRENLELVIMHAYYKDVDEARFQSLMQSIDYVIELVMKEARSHA